MNQKLRATITATVIHAMLLALAIAVLLFADSDTCCGHFDLEKTPSLSFPLTLLGGHIWLNPLRYLVPSTLPIPAHYIAWSLYVVQWASYLAITLLTGLFGPKVYQGTWKPIKIVLVSFVVILLFRIIFFAAIISTAELLGIGNA